LILGKLGGMVRVDLDRIPVRNEGLSDESEETCSCSVQLEEVDTMGRFQQIAQPLLGLLILVLVEVGLAFAGVPAWAVGGSPPSVGAATTSVAVALLAVAVALASYFLRTFWALLVVPAVFWGGAALGDLLTGRDFLPDPASAGSEGVFVLAFFLPLVTGAVILVTSVGVLLGKWIARTRSSAAVV
jgi:hypothetical protein